MGARASSILRKHKNGEGNAGQGKIDVSLIVSDSDWSLMRLLMDFPYTIEQSAKNKDPSILAAYAHQLASEFSAWYRDNPVLKNDNPDISASRLALVTAIKEILRRASNLLCIPFLDAM